VLTETSAKPAKALALGPSPRGLVVALIPAHDEEEQIEGAIESLRGQVSPPDLIIVCADNCSDRTAERAEAAGAIVFETVDEPLICLYPDGAAEQGRWLFPFGTEHHEG
jgi:hypothetical protein